MNYTYIVECADGTYYTGWTNDPEKRLRAHNDGKGAKYTKNRRPVHFVYLECHEDRIDAMRREFAIKQLTRQEKERLVQSEENHLSSWQKLQGQQPEGE